MRSSTRSWRARRRPTARTGALPSRTARGGSRPRPIFRSGETLRTFEELTDAQLDQKLAGAEKAYRTYRRTSFADRARWLAAAADILESEKDRIGRLMTLEMGEPIAAARAEAA